MRLLLLACLVGCSGKGDDSTSTLLTGATTPTGTATGTATATGTGTGTGTGSTTGTPTGTTQTTGTLALGVSNADAQCGQYTYGTGTSLLTADPGPAPGEVNVTHTAFSIGCCPSFSVVARADLGLQQIDVMYTTEPDYCDCVCTLDAAYRLTGVPSGSWTVMAAGDSAMVVVP